MKIEMTSTDKITELDGVSVRVWEGVTETGIRCIAFVHRLAVHVEDDAEQFGKELDEKLPPGRSVPLSAVLL